MKLLGLIMQNKKGENILMVSAPSLPIRYCAVYSHMIYQHILEIYRNRLKIERTITLEENLFCVVNITKEYILYVFTTKNDLPLAFDGIRKVTEFFNKSGSTAAARLELILKKTVEFMSIFQQFLYTRELPFRDFLPMKHPVTSKKKSVDDEIFNKFAHIGSESDKQIIFSSQIASGKVEALQAKKKIRIIQNAQSFQLKSQDDMYLLDIDPEKERYINAYKSSIFKLAMGRKKINRDVYSDDSILVYSESKIGSSIAPKGESNIMVEASSKMKTQNKIEELQQGQKLKLRIKQKLSLELRNEKVKEVHQHGQIFLEGTQVHQAKVILVNETLWKNPKVVSKRITPNSIPCEMISELEYLVKTPQGFKSKPVIDYVLRTETFTPEKIPLLFIYTMEVNSSNIEFTFKYKVNDKWKTKLLDLEITVLLNKQFVVLDCKSIPVAHSLKNNKVVWKTKEIVPGSSNSKGKILLAFGQAKFPPKEILSQVRLSMKSNCGLMQSLGVLCKQQDIGHECTAERTLLIDYKIHP